MIFRRRRGSSASLVVLGLLLVSLSQRVTSTKITRLRGHNKSPNHQQQQQQQQRDLATVFQNAETYNHMMARYQQMPTVTDTSEGGNDSVRTEQEYQKPTEAEEEKEETFVPVHPKKEAPTKLWGHTPLVSEALEEETAAAAAAAAAVEDDQPGTPLDPKGIYGQSRAEGKIKKTAKGKTSKAAKAPQPPPPPPPPPMKEATKADTDEKYESLEPKKEKPTSDNKVPSTNEGRDDREGEDSALEMSSPKEEEESKLNNTPRKAEPDTIEEKIEDAADMVSTLEDNPESLAPEDDEAGEQTSKGKENGNNQNSPYVVEFKVGFEYRLRSDAADATKNNYAELAEATAHLFNYRFRSYFQDIEEVEFLSTDRLAIFDVKSPTYIEFTIAAYFDGDYDLPDENQLEDISAAGLRSESPTYDYYIYLLQNMDESNPFQSVTRVTFYSQSSLLSGPDNMPPEENDGNSSGIYKVVIPIVLVLVVCVVAAMIYCGWVESHNVPEDDSVLDAPNHGTPKEGTKRMTENRHTVHSEKPSKTSGLSFEDDTTEISETSAHFVGDAAYEQKHYKQVRMSPKVLYRTVASGDIKTRNSFEKVSLRKNAAVAASQGEASLENMARAMNTFGEALNSRRSDPEPDLVNHTPFGKFVALDTGHRSDDDEDDDDDSQAGHSCTSIDVPQNSNRYTLPPNTPGGFISELSMAPSSVTSMSVSPPQHESTKEQTELETKKTVEPKIDTMQVQSGFSDVPLESKEIARDPEGEKISDDSAVDDFEEEEVLSQETEYEEEELIEEEDVIEEEEADEEMVNDEKTQVTVQEEGIVEEVIAGETGSDGEETVKTNQTGTKLSGGNLRNFWEKKTKKDQDLKDFWEQKAQKAQQKK